MATPLRLISITCLAKKLVYGDTKSIGCSKQGVPCKPFCRAGFTPLIFVFFSVICDTKRSEEPVSEIGGYE
jgi:hypothetical protein